MKGKTLKTEFTTNKTVKMHAKFHGHTLQNYLQRHLDLGLHFHSFFAEKDANGNMRLTINTWHGGWEQVTFVVEGNQLSMEKRIEAGDLNVPAFLKYQAD